MVQRKAKDLPLGQLVKLNSGAFFAPRWAEVCRQTKDNLGLPVTWVKVVDAPEQDLLGAETTIEGSETFFGIGWMCVCSLPAQSVY